VLPGTDGFPGRVPVQHMILWCRGPGIKKPLLTGCSAGFARPSVREPRPGRLHAPQGAEGARSLAARGAPAEAQRSGSTLDADAVLMKVCGFRRATAAHRGPRERELAADPLAAYGRFDGRKRSTPSGSADDRPAGAPALRRLETTHKPGSSPTDPGRKAGHHGMPLPEYWAVWGVRVCHAMVLTITVGSGGRDVRLA
jgi:hypothetical protein